MTAPLPRATEHTPASHYGRALNAYAAWYVEHIQPGALLSRKYGFARAMGSGDSAAGPEVTFPSPRYGPEQWAEFTAEPTCIEGHREQRLRITVDEPAGASR